jgi:hypothetical protein
MNLVQINERLKDMPLRAVEMYANGSNPQVPAYLALAEMQRREKLSKQAAIEQGAAQGQMPSIKEQIEQRSGLMALQQGRMQQGQQQMANQSSSRPMPVPPNIEPAEEQPQAEDSGIARIPVKEDMYRFARGGIIAFNGEGSSYVMSPEEIATLPTHAEQMEALRRNNEVITAKNIRESKRRAEKEREEKLRFLDTASPTAAANVRREESSRAFNPEASATPEPTVAQLQRILNPQSSRGAAANVRPSGNVQPTVVQQSPEAAKPTAEAAPTNTSKLPDIFTDPTYMNVVKESMKQKTPQELFQEQKDMLRMQGITGPLGAEQERRAKERQAAYESSRPTGLQDLARVLGQAGQFKGMSGIAPAYTSLQQQRRAEDLKFREQQDRLLDEIEEKRRAEATGRAGAIREDIFKGRDIASRTAGAVSSAQIQAQAEFVKQGMSEAAAERLAGIKFDYDKRLRATPQAQRATLEEQYVADLVKNGLPRHLAIAEAKKLGSSDEGVESRTLKNLADTANKTLEITSGATDAEKAAARTVLEQVKKRQMELSGLGGGASTGKVMSMADVQATAAKNNKTIAEVIEAAKKAGYTIK